MSNVIVNLYGSYECTFSDNSNNSKSKSPSTFWCVYTVPVKKALLIAVGCVQVPLFIQFPILISFSLKLLL